jgi:tetratricopeptide (TPR) repeat protein
LDKYIAQNDHYVGLKEKQIHNIMHKMEATTQNNYQQLHYSALLFDEYKSYKYDSAYVYAVKTLEIANKLKNTEKINEAKIRLVFCYLSSGLFKESFDLVNGMNISQAMPNLRLEYYKVMARLYYDLADYNSVQPFKNQYIDKGILYSDSAISLLPLNSIQRSGALGLIKMKKNDYTGAIENFQEVIKNTKNYHDFAIAASSLGYINILMNQQDEAIINIIKAAIADIKSSTKETVALRLLAKQLYENKHDVNRAYKYVKIALDDANFYNARHRKIEIGSILPIIEKERINTIEGQRNLLIWLVVLVTLLFGLFLASTLIIYKQLKKIKAARQIIETQNEKVLLVNTELKESNNIKDKYIGHFFYINYQYIDKLEHIYRIINRKVALKQHEELTKLFRQSDLENERTNMYKSFDETFLKLFPDFINEYKKLFPTEEWSGMNIENDHLNIELRIFALIRLGIYESEKIGKFLNYSVHTINTYKTKVKNKSIVANELFEKKIMEIKYEKPDL